MNELRKMKNDIRAELLQKRHDLDPVLQADWDNRIAKTFLASISYRFCDVVLIYLSMKNEVSTVQIIETALADGKIVACPISNTQNNSLTFHVIKSLDNLTPGSYGILEPSPDAPDYLTEITREGAKKNPLTLCVVPCLSYDSEGFRIGYGKGYYDRFLSVFEGTKIGLCYTSCKEKKLPRGKYDIKLNVMITEKGVETYK